MSIDDTKEWLLREALREALKMAYRIARALGGPAYVNARRQGSGSWGVATSLSPLAGWISKKVPETSCSPCRRNERLGIDVDYFIGKMARSGY